MSTAEQTHQQDLERLKALRYMDDDFMTVCLADNFEVVELNEGNELFGDGSHIIYVNGKYRGNDEVGKLMHDFSCTNPDDMNYETLAKRARYFKQDEELLPCVKLWKI